jgi:cellobiose epimerase
MDYDSVKKKNIEGSVVLTLQASIENELRSDILPFWLNHCIDEEFGGFRGQISNDLVIDPHADKGLILNARVLWTFSSAFERLKEPKLLDAAHRAYSYIERHFLDPEFGGMYWMVDYQGRPADTKKRIYGQAFAIYAMTEYYRVSGRQPALDMAIRLFNAIEQASYDSVHGGYFETYERGWSLATDQRLSEVDMDEKKSMNTNLHVMEAYAALLRVWPDATLRLRLRELIEIFRKKILNPRNNHLFMFFNEQWEPKSEVISFGHDIEASWLLVEAAEVLGDPHLLEAMRRVAVQMAQSVFDEAVDADGGLLYEADSSGLIDSDKHWWPQAEAVVGFLNAYQISGAEHFLRATKASWSFIDQYIVDHTYGEWFWKVSRDGVASTDKYKVDPWKCPYHNGRACLEAMRRITEIQHS